VVEWHRPERSRSMNSSPRSRSSRPRNQTSTSHTPGAIAKMPSPIVGPWNGVHDHFGPFGARRVGRRRERARSPRGTATHVGALATIKVQSASCHAPDGLRLVPLRIKLRSGSSNSCREICTERRFSGSRTSPPSPPHQDSHCEKARDKGQDQDHGRIGLPAAINSRCSSERPYSILVHGIARKID